MTLPWTICLYDNTKSTNELHAAAEAGFQEIERIDAWMSEWKSESLLSQINTQAGIAPVAVTDETFHAIKLALEHAKLTDGAYDITFNAFFGLYSWKEGNERFPTDAEIKSRLPLVNYKNVILNEKKKTVFLKKKGMKIGLGGMGEGWAVDKVFELLQPRKIQSGYVDASGAVRVWGRRPDGKFWTVGVGNPRPLGGANAQELYKLYVTDVAVSTAGDTQRSFKKNGRLFHHIIDPKTGYSAQQSIQVTTICKTALLCDLADTGAFILGPKKGAKYLEKLGIEGVFVDPDKKVHLTKGLEPIQTVWGPSLKIKN